MYLHRLDAGQKLAVFVFEPAYPEKLRSLTRGLPLLDVLTYHAESIHPVTPSKKLSLIKVAFPDENLRS
jgi:hypothetical protein